MRNHSPTGPSWGYGGSGPAQLSLAIMLAVTDEATAERFYQRFKWSVVAPIEADRWALDAGDVLGWLDSAAGAPGGAQCLRMHRLVRPLHMEDPSRELNIFPENGRRTDEAQSRTLSAFSSRRCRSV